MGSLTKRRLRLKATQIRKRSDQQHYSSNTKQSRNNQPSRLLLGDCMGSLCITTEHQQPAVSLWLLMWNRCLVAHSRMVAWAAATAVCTALSHNVKAVSLLLPLCWRDLLCCWDKEKHRILSPPFPPAAAASAKYRTIATQLYTLHSTPCVVVWSVRLRRTGEGKGRTVSLRNGMRCIERGSSRAAARHRATTPSRGYCWLMTHDDEKWFAIERFQMRIRIPNSYGKILFSFTASVWPKSTIKQHSGAERTRIQSRVLEAVYSQQTKEILTGVRYFEDECLLLLLLLSWIVLTKRHARKLARLWRFRPDVE